MQGIHTTSDAALQRQQERGMVCREIGDYACSPLFNSETSHRKDLCGHNIVDGYNGRKITVEIYTTKHSGNIGFSEFCQYVVLRKVLQTTRWNEPAGVQK